MRRWLALPSLSLLLVVAAHAQPRAGTPANDPRAPQPRTTIADTMPPPVGVPNLAWLASLELNDVGHAMQPADSLRRAFMSAFRGAFAEGAYATERVRAGRPLASLPASARFRLIEGTGGYGVWNVQVILDALPHGDRPELTGFRVTVAALSPQATDAGARPIPARSAFTIAPRESGDDGRPGRARTPVQWWRIAGRTSALLALEHLHHLSGDLEEDAHLALGPAQRVEADAGPAPGPPPGRRHVKPRPPKS